MDNNDINLNDLDLLATAHQNIWFDVKSRKYYFNDETYDLHGPYPTAMKAKLMLNRYRKEVLGS